MSADLLAAFGPGCTRSSLVNDHRSSPESTSTKPNSPEVLFDANEVHDEDEFGEFEDAQETSEHGHAKSSPGVASLLAVTQSQSSVTNLKVDPLGNDDQDGWGDFSGPVPDANTPKVAVSQGKHSQLKDVQTELEEEWEPFDTDSSPKVQEAPIRKEEGLRIGPEKTSLEGLARSDRSVSAGGQQDVDEVEKIRPTNIPPPAILLQLLPEIFEILRSSVIKCETERKSVHRNTLLTTVGRSVVPAFVVAARVIAGRTLRWKRDAVLAQSTKIGLAVSGGGRGMKLASIDKSENLKEEKETADVVAEWEKHAHLFNSTTSKAGIHRPAMHLATSLRPRPLEALEGAHIIKAAKACALCGLRREERIPHVDIDVEDSFGEFWVEHWGHRDCRDIWVEYKELLSHR